jgi:hypothetical protein
MFAIDTNLLVYAHNMASRKRVFDIAIAATLKDNGIQGLYTANPDDFKQLDFLDVINPLEKLVTTGGGTQSPDRSK